MQAEPWERSAADLAALMRRSFEATAAPAPALDVAPLGVRDAFTDAPTDEADAPDAVPVRFYGRHAVVGPFPDGESHRPCARCLARRWQGVRSVALREALELGSGTRAAGESPYITPFTADALAGIVAARLAGQGPRTGSFPAVHLVDLETLQVRHYPLVPDPECPVAGGANRTPPTRPSSR